MKLTRIVAFCAFALNIDSAKTIQCEAESVSIQAKSNQTQFVPPAKRNERTSVKWLGTSVLDKRIHQGIFSFPDLMTTDFYQNPLIARYASPEMSRIWGDQKKFSIWRRLWIALAESEKELGIDISDEQLSELRNAQDDIDFEKAREYEKKLRHDVMAHVHTYGDACPNARSIIHLGATSCFVTDNTDLILIKESLELVEKRLAQVIVNLGAFAKQHRDLACLGYTHLQPAQPTTVGKRACLWAYDFAMDLEEIRIRIGALKARSTKGTTGNAGEFFETFRRRPRQGSRIGAKGCQPNWI